MEYCDVEYPSDDDVGEDGSIVMAPSWGWWWSTGLLSSATMWNWMGNSVFSVLRWFWRGCLVESSPSLSSWSSCPLSMMVIVIVTNRWWWWWLSLVGWGPHTLMLMHPFSQDAAWATMSMVDGSRRRQQGRGCFTEFMQENTGERLENP